MVKFTILLKRKASLTHAEFVEHHKGVHAKLFMSIPTVKETVRRYLQEHTLPVDLPGMPPAKYDGITELWLTMWSRWAAASRMRSTWRGCIRMKRLFWTSMGATSWC